MPQKYSSERAVTRDGHARPMLNGRECWMFSTFSRDASSLALVFKARKNRRLIRAS